MKKLGPLAKSWQFLIRVFSPPQLSNFKDVKQGGPHPIDNRTSNRFTTSYHNRQVATQRIRRGQSVTDQKSPQRPLAAQTWQQRSFIAQTWQQRAFIAQTWQQRAFIAQTVQLEPPTEQSLPRIFFNRPIPVAANVYYRSKRYRSLQYLICCPCFRKPPPV